MKTKFTRVLSLLRAAAILAMAIISLGMAYNNEANLNFAEHGANPTGAPFTPSADILFRGTITYNLTGGIGGPTPNPAFVFYGPGRHLSTTRPLHAAANFNGEMVSVTFVGWSLSSPPGILAPTDSLPPLVTTVTVPLNGNVDVYAVWQFVQTVTHSVTFVLNGGHFINNTDYVVVGIANNETIGTTMPHPSRTGYSLNGWQESGSGNVLRPAAVAAMVVDRPLIFTASWTPNIGGGGPITTIPEEPVEEEPVEEEPVEEEPIEDPAEEPAPEDPPDQELPETEQPTTEPAEQPQQNITEPLSEQYPDPDITIVEFTLTDIGNPINGNIRYFRITNRASAGLQFLSADIPAFTRGYGLFYKIHYRTNLNSLPRLIAENIPANRPFLLMPPYLEHAETISEIIITFDTVPAGFRLDNTITYRFAVIDEENIANRWEVMFGETSNRNFFIAASLSNIDRITNYQGRYDSASWENLQAVMLTVQEILANPNSTAADIEMAYFMLQQAMANLTPLEYAPPNLARPEIFIAIAIFGLFVLLGIALAKLIKHKKRQLVSLPSGI